MCGLSVDVFISLFRSCFEVEQNLNDIADNVNVQCIVVVSSLCPPDCDVHGQDVRNTPKGPLLPPSHPQVYHLKYMDISKLYLLYELFNYTVCKYHFQR